MRILIIGGTRFVGRHLTAAALERGHAVTLFHRGRTGADLFPEGTHILGDRDQDLSGLDEGRWDATIDVSAYEPRQVESLATALGGRGGHHTYISTVSVYEDPAGPGITEAAPLRDASDRPSSEDAAMRYGELKAACEFVAAESHSSPLVVRPTYVVGPHDYTGRFPYWVARLARGGEVLAPGPPDAPVQSIDARDLADFVIGLLETSHRGIFHTASPRPPFTFVDLLDRVAAAVAPPGTTLHWVGPDALLAAGISGQALPLWSEGRREWALAVDPTAAYAVGLTPRPLASTAEDTWRWIRTEGFDLETWLSPERERELLARHS